MSKESTRGKIVDTTYPVPTYTYHCAFALDARDEGGRRPCRLHKEYGNGRVVDVLLRRTFMISRARSEDEPTADFELLVARAGSSRHIYPPACVLAIHQSTLSLMAIPPADAHPRAGLSTHRLHSQII